MVRTHFKTDELFIDNGMKEYYLCVSVGGGGVVVVLYRNSGTRSVTLTPPENSPSILYVTDVCVCYLGMLLYRNGRTHRTGFGSEALDAARLLRSQVLRVAQQVPVGRFARVLRGGERTQLHGHHRTGHGVWRHRVSGVLTCRTGLQGGATTQEVGFHLKCFAL